VSQLGASARKGTTVVPEPKITFTITGITPACPGMERPGLDGEIFIALQGLDSLIRDMRLNIGVPNQVIDQDAAVKRYLVYLSVLVDVVFSEMAMSAVHGNDLAALMAQRMLIEYAAKAEYFHLHPDYALYMMTINEAESVLKKNILAGTSDAAIILDLEAYVARTTQKFQSVAHLKPRTFFEILTDLASSDEYVWLYGAPSSLIHGDPEGIRQIIPVDDKGNQTVVLKLADGHLNAVMVDAGGNTSMFCRAFVKRFHPDNADLNGRLDGLDRMLKALILKHPLGRDQAVLDSIRADLEGDAAHG
jgi:hypothetical protein